MTLNAMKLGVAAAAATLFAWVVCSLLVAIAPDLTMTITGHLLHIDPTAHSWALTWGGFAMGAICWAGLAFLFAFVLGATYNTLAGREVPA